METTEIITEIFTEATTASEYIQHIASDVQVISSDIHLMAQSVTTIDTMLRWIIVGIVAIALYKLLRIFF